MGCGPMSETAAKRGPWHGRPRITVVDGGAIPGGAHSEDRRHAVIVSRGRIDQAADDCADGLFADASPYYQRGEMLVRLIESGDASSHRQDGGPLLVPATQAMLLDDLERTCRFVSRTENADSGEVRMRLVACPKGLPGVVMARAGRLPIPTVRGIAEVPLLHADGEMIFSGYAARAGVVVVAPGVWPAVSDVPTDADARAALAKIDAVLVGFPFVTDVDRAVTIAALLSAVLRPTLPACPAFAWSAPVRGSGKSKLADVAAVLATGRTAPALTWPPQEDEAEKRLGASVMAGDAVILLDNIETALRGACLNSLLTQPTVSLRLLGRSQMVRVGAAVLVLATGNNLVLHGDLSRRFLVSNLDPHDERPELRRFDFDPVDRAKRERGTLVAALHTIARWGAARPSGLPPLGSFEVWSRRVRDPLVALGLPDCCAVLDELHKADPEREVAIELLTEWHRAFDCIQTTCADAVRAAMKDPALRDALDAVAGGPGGINTRRLGRYMLRIRDRVFGGMVVRQHRDLVGNVASWAIEDSSTGYRVTGDISNGDRINGEIHKGVNGDPANPVTPSLAAADDLDFGPWSE